VKLLENSIVKIKLPDAIGKLKGESTEFLTTDVIETSSLHN
jgi:hypothetical protein